MNEENFLKESMRIRLSTDEKAEFDGIWKSKKISQQDAVVAILRWFRSQDPIFQSVILGQIQCEERDIAQFLVKRIMAEVDSGATTAGKIDPPARTAKPTAARQVPKDPPPRRSKD